MHPAEHTNSLSEYHSPSRMSKIPKTKNEEQQKHGIRLATNLFATNKNRFHHNEVSEAALLIGCYPHYLGNPMLKKSRSNCSASGPYFSISHPSIPAEGAEMHWSALDTAHAKRLRCFNVPMVEQRWGYAYLTRQLYRLRGHEIPNTYSPRK